MTNRLIVNAIASVVASVFAFGVWLSDDPKNFGWLRFYSAAVLLVTLLLMLWEHWVWRWPIIQRIPKIPRSVRGTWKGEIKSHWIDPSTGAPVSPKAIFLVVRQTASTVKVDIHTDESTSRSGIGSVQQVGGSWTLDYMYLNTPLLSVQDRSRIHHGSCSLQLAGLPTVRMAGQYWTDRDSKGELTFADHRVKLADDYRDAIDMFSDAK